VLAAHGFHPLDGALWLRGQGLERLAGLVAHHTAARFEAEAHGLGEGLAAFADECSVVTDALAYSDLTTGPAGERVSVAERLGEIERRYGRASTVVRALESAVADDGRSLRAGPAETALFIRPGFAFKVVSGLITNFHLPKSSLLMLVSAFAGRDQVLAAYRQAIAERYRFYSYGDAMFIA
jgi:hypothetical protein